MTRLNLSPTGRCRECDERPHEHEKRRVFPDDGPTGSYHHEYWCPGSIPDDLPQGVPHDDVIDTGMQLIDSMTSR